MLLVACALLAVRASSCANRSCTDCFDAHAACVWCFDATHPRYDPTGALVGACTDVASAPAPGMGRCFAGSSARCSCRSLITLSVAACTSCEEDGCVWCGLSSWRSVGFCVDSFGSASCPTNSSLVMPVDSCPVPALATWLRLVGVRGEVRFAHRSPPISVLITIGLAGMFSGVSLLFTLLQKKRYEAFQQAEALGLVR